MRANKNILIVLSIAGGARAHIRYAYAPPPAHRPARGSPGTSVAIGHHDNSTFFPKLLQTQLAIRWLRREQNHAMGSRSPHPPVNRFPYNRRMRCPGPHRLTDASAYRTNTRNHSITLLIPTSHLQGLLIDYRSMASTSLRFKNPDYHRTSFPSTSHHPNIPERDNICGS